MNELKNANSLAGGGMGSRQQLFLRHTSIAAHPDPGRCGDERLPRSKVVGAALPRRGGVTQSFKSSLQIP